MEKGNTRPEAYDVGSLSDKELLDVVSSQTATKEQRADAIDTISARNEYGVFDPNRPEVDVAEEYDTDLMNVGGVDLDMLEDESPAVERIRRTRSGDMGKAAKRAAEIASEVSRGGVREFYPKHKMTPEETSANEAAKAEFGERQARLEAENTQAVGEIKNTLIKSDRELRATYLTSGMRHLAKGHLDIPTSTLLFEGYSERHADDLMSRFSATTPGEIARENRIRGVLSEASQIAAEQIENDKIKGLQRAALRAATKRGVTVETDPATDEEKRTLALPIERKGDGQLQKYMTSLEFNPTSDDIRTVSYEGFYNIANALKNDAEPDTKALDWYFTNFGYAEHYSEFEDAVLGMADGDDAATNLIQKFNLQKLDELTAPDPAVESEKEPNADADSPLIDLENAQELNVSDLQEVGSTDQMIELAVDRYISSGCIKGLFPSSSREFNPNPVPPGPEPAPRPRPVHTDLRYGAIIGACCYLSNKIDPNLNSFVPPRIARRRGFNLPDSVTEAMKNDQRHKSTDDYTIIRYGANGKNFVIAECTTPNSGATFFWEGSSEYGDNEEWRNIMLTYSRSELKKMINAGDPRVQGCDYHTHKGHDSCEQMIRIIEQQLHSTYRLEDSDKDELSAYISKATESLSKRRQAQKKVA